MNRYAVVAVVVASFANLGFAQAPREMHSAGRLLDVLRPGMRVKVVSYSGEDPIGIRIEILSDEGWQDLKMQETEHRDQIAVLEGRYEQLQEQASDIREQVSQSLEKARNSPPAFRSFRSDANPEELRKSFSQDRDTNRELITKQQELGRQSQALQAQIRGLEDTLPAAYSTIAHIGDDYFSVESEYGVKFYPGDRIREIYRRKFRPNGGSTPPAEAPRPAT